MKTLIAVDNGEYEDRRTVFVAVDEIAALVYMQALYPNIPWSLYSEPPYSGANILCKFIAPANWFGKEYWERAYDERYDLVEIDFADGEVIEDPK